MPYINRDKKGAIIALFDKKSPGAEHIAFDHPDVLQFFIRCDAEKTRMLASDLQLIRVVEDLINILIRKNVITITDFPDPVIKKLLARQDIHKRLSSSVGMEFRENEI